MKPQSLFILIAVELLPIICLAGGLDSGTSAAETFKTWLFSFIGIAAVIYLLYTILMTLLEQKSWRDVILALGKCILAGGALSLAAWGLGLAK